MKNKTKGAAQKDGSATAEDPGAAGRQIEKLGAAKDWGGNKGDESAETKAKVKKVKEEAPKDYEGSPRMGYTQNFGPARQNGYAKGAAKVNSIMRGAAQADKPGGESRVGQVVDGKVITHDPEHKDLGPVGRFSNTLSTSDFNLGGGGQSPGDAIHNVRRYGGSSGSVNRFGETKVGFNFFPPSESEKVQGKTVPSRPNPFTEGNRSGGTDNIFNDSRQDGTMLGRGIRRVQNWWNS